MDVGNTSLFFSFVLEAAIVIILLVSSKETQRKVKNIMDILNNGAYTSCPFYDKICREGGSRWYDNNPQTRQKSIKRR